ncbi:hypothetical protein [Ferroacidibacillus organovorans]|uniref:Uncharacterized protein n=1 Tax=Ferroacidibacillus organovorans TaxID=1765683 RepID=A0A1V4ERG2_9BACL|nr:hypothetical protein [Ferroacidibacillus organovorans]OPG15440.1 hypothetical protein B2M26_11860 [Ferroacidibacillus organovorans]
MATSIKETNNEVFARLLEHIPEQFQHLVVNDDDDPRRIFATDEEQELLKHSKVDDIMMTLPNKPVVKIRYKSLTQTRFFVVIPEHPYESITPFIGNTASRNDAQASTNGVLLSNNAGLLTLLWAQVKELPVHTHKGDELIDEVFGVKGLLEVDKIKKHFMDCDIWEVDKDIFEKNPFSLYGAWLTHYSENLSISFSDDTLVLYRRMFEQSFGEFTGEPLFRSLTATHFSHSFLEIYRCIERLYSIPFIKELLKVTNSNIKNSQFAVELEKQLSWRPKEEDALIKLIRMLDDTELLLNLKKELGIADTASEEKLEYQKIRNIIHSTLGSADLLGQSLEKEQAATVHIRDEDSEDSAQGQLIDALADTLTESIRNIIPGSSKLNPDSLPRAVGKAIYQLRNSIAHWRPSGDSSQQPDNWEAVLFLINQLVFQLYKLFEEDIAAELSS